MFNLLVSEESLKVFERQGYCFIQESDKETVMYNRAVHPVCIFVQVDKAKIALLTAREGLYGNRVYITPRLLYECGGYAMRYCIENGKNKVYGDCFDPDFEYEDGTTIDETQQLLKDLAYLRWYKKLNK